MIGVLGSASVGVNTQRYSDAVNTFNAVVQQEFTNVTNVVNLKSIENMCGAGDDSERPRGISDCAIIGRMMTVDGQGNIVRSNLVGMDPGTADDDDTELEVIRSYMGEGRPIIDLASQEQDTMSWETKLERGNPLAPTYASVLIVRSPRSGNVYSYVIHSASSIITNDEQLRDSVSELISTSPAPNSRDQYMCIDRSGWAVTPARAVKLAAYASGPSSVSITDTEGSKCDS